MTSIRESHKQLGQNVHPRYNTIMLSNLPPDTRLGDLLDKLMKLGAFGRVYSAHLRKTHHPTNNEEPIVAVLIAFFEREQSQRLLTYAWDEGIAFHSRLVRANWSATLVPDVEEPDHHNASRAIVISGPKWFVNVDTVERTLSQKLNISGHHFQNLISKKDNKNRKVLAIMTTYAAAKAALGVLNSPENNVKAVYGRDPMEVGVTWKLHDPQALSPKLLIQFNDWEYPDAEESSSKDAKVAKKETEHYVPPYYHTSAGTARPPRPTVSDDIEELNTWSTPAPAPTTHDTKENPTKVAAKPPAPAVCTGAKKTTARDPLINTPAPPNPAAKETKPKTRDSRRKAPHTNNKPQSKKPKSTRRVAFSDERPSTREIRNVPYKDTEEEYEDETESETTIPGSWTSSSDESSDSDRDYDKYSHKTRRRCRHGHDRDYYRPACSHSHSHTHSHIHSEPRRRSPSRSRHTNSHADHRRSKRETVSGEYDGDVKVPENRVYHFILRFLGF